MNYETWLGLTDSERSDLKRIRSAEFDVPGSELLKVLNEAIEALKKQLGARDSISSILAGRNAISNEPIILVCSIIDNDALIADVPSHAYGFDVVQEPLGAIRKRYLSCWRAIFRHILGWSDSSIEAWCVKWKDFLEGRKFPFYHQSPVYYAAGTIIGALAPDFMGKGLPRVQLEKKIILVIESQGGAGFSFPNEVENYDWTAAKDRIMAAIRSRQT